MADIPVAGCLSVIPKLNPKTLADILDILPSDYSVQVWIDDGLRHVDYSALEDQIRKDNPFAATLDFSSPSLVEYSLHMPKEKLLELYSAHYAWRSLLGEKNDLPRYMAERHKLRLDVRGIGWSWTCPTPSDPEWAAKVGTDAIGIRICVAPNMVSVKYPVGDAEPRIVGSLRKILKDSEINLVVEQYL